MPENSRSLRKAKPSVANTLSGRPATASKSSTASWTFRMSTAVPISSCAAVPVMAATPTRARFLGSFTSRPAMYTPMVTVRNFSSSPRPPNWPSMISLNTSSPVAAPRAADRGSNSMARVRGMNRKYSTENSTTPTWNLGISSVNRVASPYRDMDRTKIISFWDCVAVCFCAILIAYFPPYDGVFLAHTGTVYHRDVNSSPKVL